MRAAAGVRARAAERARARRGAQEQERGGLKRLIDGGAARGGRAAGREGASAPEPLTGYEGVAQAGHAEVSMATAGDKSSRSIPE